MIKRGEKGDGNGEEEAEMMKREVEGEKMIEDDIRR